jgi:leucyl aminopeptidase
MAHIKKLEYDKNMDNAKNSDILALGIFEDKNDSKLINSQMKGKVGELAYDFSDNQKILYFGLGKSDSVTPEDFRRAAGSVMAFIISNKYASIAVQCPKSDSNNNYFCQAFLQIKEEIIILTKLQ